MEQSVIDDLIDGAANREMELPIVGHDIPLMCVKRFTLYKLRIPVNVVLFTGALYHLPKLYLTTCFSFSFCLTCFSFCCCFFGLCAYNEPLTMPFAGETGFEGWPREISQSSASSYPWNQRAWETREKGTKEKQVPGTISVSLCTVIKGKN